MSSNESRSEVNATLKQHRKKTWKTDRFWKSNQCQYFEVDLSFIIDYISINFWCTTSTLNWCRIRKDVFIWILTENLSISIFPRLNKKKQLLTLKFIFDKETKFYIAVSREILAVVDLKYFKGVVLWNAWSFL